MKKMITLVLSLALVLALCTVAFAAGTTYKNYEVCTIDGVNLGDPIYYDMVKYDASDANIAYWSIGGLAYVETKTPANGDRAVISRGDSEKNVLFYLTRAYAVTATVAPVTEYGQKLVDFKSSLSNDYKACGKYLVTGFDSAKTYYAIVDKDGAPLGVYVQDNGGSVNLMIGGKLVSFTSLGVPTKNTHSWAFSAWDKDGNPTAATCANCKTVAKFTRDYDLAKKSGAYEPLSNGYVYGLPAAAGAAPAANVTSAKTFDAGVAMYAGLALMSVAGSAVVLGKKKAF